MGQFSMVHILILLVIVLVFFGPSRLPALGSSLGKAIRDFKNGLDGKLDEDEKSKEQLAQRDSKELPSSGAQKSETRSESKKENS